MISYVGMIQIRSQHDLPVWRTGIQIRSQVLSAGLKMLKNLKKDAFSRAVLAAVLLAMVSCSVLAVSFSSIFYILLSGAAGLAVYGVQQLRKEAGAK